MARFDVYKTPKPALFPLLLDVQADLLSRLSSRVVIPMMTLARYGAKPITRLHPVVSIRGVDYVVVTQELAALPAAALREPIASLAAKRGTVIAALDLLLTGS